MKILVTGGAGYVGSALVPSLAADGHEVRVLENFALSSPRNLTDVDVADYEFLRGDVRDAEAVDRAMEGVDAVVHLAAVTGAGDSHEQAERVRDINAGGTETVVAAAEDHGVGRIVLASSCNVYGDAYALHLTEDAEPAPRNPYAESKLAAERTVAESDLEAVSLRLATNFGHSPGVRFNLVVNAFVFRALVGDPLTVYGDGTNWRPFLHVRDTARAFESALSWEPGVYNVGLDNFQIAEIADAVAATVGRPVDVTYLEEEDPGPSYHVDFQRMRGTDFEPEYDLESGIRDLAERFTGPEVPARP